MWNIVNTMLVVFVLALVILALLYMHRFSLPVPFLKRNTHTIPNQPTMSMLLDTFPQGTHSKLMTYYLKKFMVAYEHTFTIVDNATMDTLTRCRMKVGQSAQEIIFRLPNNLHLEVQLKNNMAQLLGILTRYIQDVQDRWQRMGV